MDGAASNKFSQFRTPLAGGYAPAYLLSSRGPTNPTALPPRPLLGPVSAVCLARLPEPSRANRFRQGLEECVAGRILIRLRSPPKPSTFRTYISRWVDLGRRLSKTTESLCYRAFPRFGLNHGRALDPAAIDKQSSGWLQILWLVRAIPV